MDFKLPWTVDKATAEKRSQEGHYEIIRQASDGTTFIVQAARATDDQKQPCIGCTLGTPRMIVVAREHEGALRKVYCCDFCFELFSKINNEWHGV